jgi:heme-degrading monooxygenase HmoA
MGEPSDRQPRAYSLLRIPVAPDRKHEFVERFTALGIFELASDANGMDRAWLLSPLAQDGEFAVLAEWPSANAYEGWLNNPVRAAVNAELTPFVAGEMTGGVFIVAHALGGEPGMSLSRTSS